jgi:hypothetical protein
MRLAVPQSLALDQDRVFLVLSAAPGLVDRFLLCVAATDLSTTLRRDELPVFALELNVDAAHWYVSSGN